MKYMYTSEWLELIFLVIKPLKESAKSIEICAHAMVDTLDTFEKQLYDHFPVECLALDMDKIANMAREHVEGKDETV